MYYFSENPPSLERLDDTLLCSLLLRRGSATGSVALPRAFSGGRTVLPPLLLPLLLRRLRRPPEDGGRESDDEEETEVAPPPPNGVWSSSLNLAVAVTLVT